jgi:diphosphomevalonate decarboxylase
MRALILVASAEKKDVSSTAGMQTTVQTSQLFKTRAEVVVPAAMAEMEKAIAERDFEAFAKVTIRDSNSFHATCLDTSPPIFYLNDVSRAAIRAVESINQRAGKMVAAYTFDAGPNAVIYYLEDDRDVVVGPFKAALGEKEGWAGEQGAAVATGRIAQEDERVMSSLKSGVSRIILTGVGEGPISVQDHLIDENGKAVEL